MRGVAVVALLAALALVAGCGDDEETTTESTSVPTATGATGAEAEVAEEKPPPGKQDGDGGPGAKESVPAGGSPEEVLELYFTSGDPDLACVDLVTPNLVSSAYGDQMGCRQAQVPAATPDSIEIMQVEESGEEATATVVPEGGPNDGIETQVVLVKEGPVWLVDSLKANVPAGP